jgi:hypothetical protein
MAAVAVPFSIERRESPPPFAFAPRFELVMSCSPVQVLRDRKARAKNKKRRVEDP